MYFFKTAAALVIICSLVDLAIATEPVSVPLQSPRKQSQLFYKWHWKSCVSDRIPYLEQSARLGKRGLDPAYGFYSLRENARQARAQFYVALENRVAAVLWAANGGKITLGFFGQPAALAANGPRNGI